MPSKISTWTGAPSILSRICPVWSPCWVSHEISFKHMVYGNMSTDGSLDNDQNTKLFIHEKTSENIVFETAAIFSGGGVNLLKLNTSKYRNCQLVPLYINISWQKPLWSTDISMNKANTRDLIAATGLVILLIDFFPCDLEIWWMTSTNNRAHLSYVKLCASFQSHGWIDLFHNNFSLALRSPNTVN